MLSLQTVKELDRLAKKFEPGMKLTVDTENGIIGIEGYCVLNEQGNIGLVRNYDLEYGLNDNDKLEIWRSDKDMMGKDRKVLEAIDLYEVFENKKEEMDL